MVTDIDDEPSDAVKIAWVGAVTLPAVKSTCPTLEPVATVTEAGTGIADWLELVVVTTMPPLGALPLRCMWIVSWVLLWGVVVSGLSAVIVSDNPPHIFAGKMFTPRTYGHLLRGGAGNHCDHS